MFRKFIKVTSFIAILSILFACTVKEKETNIPKKERITNRYEMYFSNFSNSQITSYIKHISLDKSHVSHQLLSTNDNYAELIYITTDSAEVVLEKTSEFFDNNININISTNTIKVKRIFK